MDRRRRRLASASALGGLAPSFTVLVTARAMQGIFAALLAPAILSLLNTTFTESKERAKAFGIFGAIGASGTVLGLLIGGSLTQFLDWRWTMFINVIFAAVVTVGGSRLLTYTRDETGARLERRGDLGGAVRPGLRIVQAESHSGDSPMTWGFLATGVVLTLAFVLRQRRADLFGVLLFLT